MEKKAAEKRKETSAGESKRRKENQMEDGCDNVLDYSRRE